MTQPSGKVGGLRSFNKDTMRFDSLFETVDDPRDLTCVSAESLRRHLWKTTLNTSVFMLKLCSECSRRLYAATPRENAGGRYDLPLSVCRRCMALNTLLQELFFDNTW